MTVVSEYGKALFMLAKEDGKIDAILQDVKAVKEILTKNKSYVKLLDTPALKKEEKLAMIDEAFRAVDESVVNLLKILSEKHSVYTFGSVCATYSALYDEEMGIEHVEAVSAVPMTDSQLKLLSEKLARITGKKIMIKNTVDKKILGGVMLRYAGVQIDGSVKSRLDAFAESLKNVVI
jgi:F-type H+-transporting ATPase subunit delta